jgi:hypothetical protein
MGMPLAGHPCFLPRKGEATAGGGVKTLRFNLAGTGKWLIRPCAVPPATTLCPAGTPSHAGEFRKEMKGKQNRKQEKGKERRI